MRPQARAVFLIAGDIRNIVTGGTLCDRMIVQELERTGPVELIIPHSKNAGLNWPLLAGIVNNLRNLFRRFPPHSLLVIDHGIYRDCFIAAKLWKRRYSCCVIGLVYHLDYMLPEMRGGGPLRRKIEGMIVGVYDYILTISRSTAHHLEQLGVSPTRMAQIPVSRRFGPQPYIPRSATEGLVEFLFVGSIEPRKGLLDAVHALARYRGPNRVTFRCVGACDRTGDYFRQLTAAAKDQPQLELIFTGAVSHEELVRYFRGADAFLFPSRWEGYGIAIEEAMCFALPVIACNAGAVPELVKHGVTGWLVPPGDVDALARSLVECIENPDERAQRGRAGLAKAEETTQERDLSEILATAIASACA